jgi:hypothetical protein
MTQKELPDMALQALLLTAQESDVNLPEDLVRRAYAIQRRHQFDRDGEREGSLQDMLRLVEDHVGTQGGNQ